VAEHFVKAALVVVKALLALVVDGADVHDYVASVQDVGVPSAYHVYCASSTGCYRISKRKD
jgi:hypothetical protein